MPLLTLHNQMIVQLQHNEGKLSSYVRITFSFGYIILWRTTKGPHCQPHLAWHSYPSLAPSVLVSLEGKRGCANYSALVLFRTLSVPVSGLTAAAAVSELAWGCRWKCWCVLLFWVVWCPGDQGIFGRDWARLLRRCGGGVVPRGDLSWEFIPECNVTLIATWRSGNPEGVWNCWQYQTERWAQTWAQRLMSLMIGGISGHLLYLKGGAHDGLSCSKFYILFDPNYTVSCVSKPSLTLKTKLTHLKVDLVVKSILFIYHTQYNKSQICLKAVYLAHNLHQLMFELWNWTFKPAWRKSPQSAQKRWKIWRSTFLWPPWCLMKIMQWVRKLQTGLNRYLMDLEVRLFCQLDIV